MAKGFTPGELEERLAKMAEVLHQELATMLKDELQRVVHEELGELRTRIDHLEAGQVFLGKKGLDRTEELEQIAQTAREVPQLKDLPRSLGEALERGGTFQTKSDLRAAKLRHPAEAIKPVTRLEGLTRHADSIAEDLAMAFSRGKETLDRVLGSEPEPGAGEDGRVSPTPQGDFDELRAALHRLQREADRLNQLMIRLEEL